MNNFYILFDHQLKVNTFNLFNFGEIVLRQRQCNFIVDFRAFNKTSFTVGFHQGDQAVQLDFFSFLFKPIRD